MRNWTWSIIALCWLTFLAVWVVSAFNVKRSVQRYNTFWLRYVLIVVVALAVVLPIKGQLGRLYRVPIPLGVVADLIAIAGLSFTVWARLVLGRNWSGNVTFKENHELITSGPYAIVRHPIYTGMLAMALATALDFGQSLAIFIFILMVVGLTTKYRQEEKVMTEHFGKHYTAYMKKTKAIIPYIL
jgi:protein-S-isoprenylcysteine O-methyltransferase Ste14